MSMIQGFLERVDDVQRLKSFSDSYLSRLLFDDGKVIGRLRTGVATISVARLESAMVRITDYEASARPALPEERGQEGDVVVPHQAEIEVYRGGTGGVVIKAVDASLGGDEDQIVIIRPENVDAVVAALLRVKAETLS